MKIKTSELTRMALNWAVCKAGGAKIADLNLWIDGHVMGIYEYCGDWSQGGPIIEQEGIELLCNLTADEAARFKAAGADWQAFHRSDRTTEGRQYATTPLVAAMRCYVARKLGPEVEVPEGLL